MFKQAKLGRGSSAGTAPLSQSHSSWPEFPKADTARQISAQCSNILDKLRLVQSWSGGGGGGGGCSVLAAVQESNSTDMRYASQNLGIIFMLC